VDVALPVLSRGGGDRTGRGVAPGWPV